MPASSPVQTILRLYGEGGGYRIEGQQRPSGWQFRVHSHSIWHEPDEGEPVDPPWLPSLDAALGCLNTGWPKLHPGSIHPDFLAAIGQRLQSFHDRTPLTASESARWRELGVAAP